MKRLAVAMLLLRNVWFFVLVVLAGVGFGWRIPVVIALSMAAFWSRIHIDTRWPKSLYPNKLYVVLDLLVSGIVGGLVAGLVLGGATTIIGSAFGVVSSVSSIPLSTKNTQGERVPLTLESSPSTAKTLNTLGLLLPVMLLGVCVLLLVSR